MKRLFILFFILTLAGCSTAQIPAYLQDKKPYVKRFYTTYDQTLAGTNAALEQLGWKVEQILDAAVYDRYQAAEDDEKNSLIITEIRQTPLFMGTRYAKMNIYVRSKKNLSEIEIRYVTVLATPFKNYEVYSNDAAVQRIFDRIESHLKPATETPGN